MFVVCILCYVSYDVSVCVCVVCRFVFLRVCLIVVWCVLCCFVLFFGGRDWLCDLFLSVLCVLFFLLRLFFLCVVVCAMTILL